MKIFLFLGLACFAVSGLPTDSKKEFQIPEQFIKLGGALTARAASWLVIDRIKSGHFRFEDKRSGPGGARITLPIDLPQFPEEINLPSLEIPLNLPPAPGQNVSGLLAMCSPRIVGLAEMVDDLVIGYDINRTATIDLTLQLPSLSVDSDYMADVLISYVEGLEIKELVITGEGLSSFGFSAFYVDMLAKGQVPISTGEFLSLDHLEFDWGFEEAFLTAENLQANGTPIDLDTIAGLIKALYDQIWLPNGPAIIESTRCLIDHAVNDCIVLDLISGVYDCLKLLPLKPECFGDEGPALLAAMESMAPRRLEYCPEATESTTTTTTGPTTTTTTGPTTTTTTGPTTTPTTTTKNPNTDDPTTTETSGGNTTTTTPTTTTTGGVVGPVTTAHGLITLVVLFVTLMTGGISQ